MSFVGIVSNNRDFNNIKKFFDKKNLLKPISLIEINEKNLKSIRNITFETLIFCRDLNYNEYQNVYLNNICKKASYLVANKDFVFLPSEINLNNANIITYGLDKRSTVTVSSISDDGYVISLQKNITTNSKQIHEIEEKSIKIKNTNNYKLYKNLINYIIKIIYEI